MTDLMFRVPSDDEISKCIITKDSVLGNSEPLVVYNNSERENIEKSENESA